LLEGTKREAAQHLAGAEAAKSVADAYSKALAAFKDQIAVLERCGPQLDRLSKAADNYEKLARIGEQLDAAHKALSGFAGEINSILDMLEGLNNKVRAAVSEVRTSAVSPAGKGVLKSADSFHRTGLYAAMHQDFHQPKTSPLAGPAVSPVPTEPTKERKTVPHPDAAASPRFTSANVSAPAGEQGWIDAGSQDGVALNTRLVVWRNGHRLGEAAVNRTYRGHSVIHAEGLRLRVGDVVLAAR
jgi:hypothetical protein